MIKATLLTFTFVSLLSSLINATEQYSDKIYIDNKLHYLYNSYPLEEYFDQYPERRPEIRIMSSALWRGYLATFEIKQDTLYVIDIQIQVPDTVEETMHEPYWISIIDKVFPNPIDRKLTWVTRILEMSTARYVSRFDFDCPPQNKRWVLIEIENGILKDKLKLAKKKYDKYLDELCAKFKDSGDYAKKREEILAQGFSEDDIDSVIRSTIIGRSKHLR